MTPEEIEALNELRSMTPAELEKVPADVYKWHCCVKDCDRFTKVKSFGVLPWILQRNKWFNISQRIWFCGRHWKNHLILTTARESQLKAGPGIEHIELLKVAE